MLLSLLSAEKVYFSDTLEPISLWATIGFVVALALTLLISLIIKKESFSSVAKCSLLAFVFYALVMGITLLVAEILKKFDTAYLEENWVSLDVIYYLLLPLLITLFIALVGGIVAFILSKKDSPIKRVFSRIYLIVLAVCTAITLVLIGMHYGKNIEGDGYYSKYLNSNALYICALAVVAVTLTVVFIVGRKDKKPFDTHCISLAGACVALSFALSYVKLWDMPTGGSITLVSFLPIMLFAYIYGTKKGLLVGFLYGVLQAVQDPWLIHPAQFILDYPIAFSMVCFAGLFTDLNVLNKLPQLKFGISALIGGSLRFFCHVLSGVFAFGAYAADLGIDNFWAYSLAYNSYVFIDIALVIMFGVILLSSKGFNHQVEKLKLSK
ncbi:MAG: energy-coupled thiamine transporter ThiT [Clostridia bacterium]|nr:energy-coupled thiamine transporter ThiT [Clostridia bacterium]